MLFRIRLSSLEFKPVYMSFELALAVGGDEAALDAFWFKMFDIDEASLPLFSATTPFSIIAILNTGKIWFC